MFVFTPANDFILLHSHTYAHAHAHSFLTMTNWIRLYHATSISFHNLHTARNHLQGSCSPQHVARLSALSAWQLGRTKRRLSGEDSQSHPTKSQTSYDTRKSGGTWASLILHWWEIVHEETVVCVAGSVCYGGCPVILQSMSLLYCPKCHVCVHFKLAPCNQDNRSLPSTCPWMNRFYCTCTCTRMYVTICVPYCTCMCICSVRSCWVLRIALKMRWNLSLRETTVSSK